jgi:hypothetical protein
MLFGCSMRIRAVWRTSNSLGFRIDGTEHILGLVRVWNPQLVDGRRWQRSKAGIKPPAPSHFQPTELRIVGHSRICPYAQDGQGNDSIRSRRNRNTRKRCTLDTRKMARTFNRFGIFNQQVTGDGMEVYFDEIELGDQAENFSEDPRWESHGNDTEFEERAIRPMHDFGYSDSQHAGGKPGEIGGIIWACDEQPAYYGERLAPFPSTILCTLRQARLYRAGSDSGIYFGWFNSTFRRNATRPLLITANNKRTCLSRCHRRPEPCRPLFPAGPLYIRRKGID